MSMYVLRVVTGQEEKTCERLRQKGIAAYCPQAMRKVRKRGNWHQQAYLVYPAYVFVQCNDAAEMYYKVRQEPGVLYWLGATQGEPEALGGDEESKIRWLCGAGPLPISKAVRNEKGALDFTSGPLKRLAELEAIRSVLIRERRATVELPLHGKEHKIALSFELEQETVSSNRAGSPP